MGYESNDETSYAKKHVAFVAGSTTESLYV